VIIIRFVDGSKIQSFSKQKNSSFKKPELVVFLYLRNFISKIEL